MNDDPGRIMNEAQPADPAASTDDVKEKPGRARIGENEVIGRAFVIVWPPGRWRILPVPSTYTRPGIASPSAADDVSAPVAVAAPYLPVGAGFVLAIPSTWLLRRVRRGRRSRSGHRRTGR